LPGRRGAAGNDTRGSARVSERALAHSACQPAGVPRVRGCASKLLQASSGHDSAASCTLGARRGQRPERASCPPHPGRCCCARARCRRRQLTRLYRCTARSWLCTAGAAMPACRLRSAAPREVLAGRRTALCSTKGALLHPSLARAVAPVVCLWSHQLAWECARRASGVTRAAFGGAACGAARAPHSAARRAQLLRWPAAWTPSSRRRRCRTAGAARAAWCVAVVLLWLCAAACMRARAAHVSRGARAIARRAAPRCRRAPAGRTWHARAPQPRRSQAAS
jgi:hypothetical protein